MVNFWRIYFFNAQYLQFSSEYGFSVFSKWFYAINQITILRYLVILEPSNHSFLLSFGHELLMTIIFLIVWYQKQKSILEEIKVWRHQIAWLAHRSCSKYSFKTGKYYIMFYVQSLTETLQWTYAIMMCCWAVRPQPALREF
jgi:hypothetical protein